MAIGLEWMEWGAQFSETLLGWSLGMVYHWAEIIGKFDDQSNSRWFTNSSRGVGIWMILGLRPQPQVLT